MKTQIRSLIILVGVLVSVAAWSQMTTPPSGNNQKTELTQSLGLVKVTIVYSSPDVAGREIWGKLVPYYNASDAAAIPWRGGANENTTIAFAHDVEVEGKALKAGTYGLHFLPGQETWTVIFSNNTMAWGSFSYKKEEDALRVDVKAVPAEMNEWLTYEFTDRQQNSATARMKWEKLAVPFKINVPNGDDLYVQKVRMEMTSNKRFNWLNVVQAANFCATKKLNLEEADKWLQTLIDNNIKYFPVYNSKANVQVAAGKQADADATMQTAINLPDATAGQITNYGRTLITNTKPKEAMAVMQVAYKRYPESSAALAGMSRGYVANGDNKNALKFMQNAYKVETNANVKTQIDGLVKRIEKGENINQ